MATASFEPESAGNRFLHYGDTLHLYNDTLSGYLSSIGFTSRSIHLIQTGAPDKKPNNPLHALFVVEPAQSHGLAKKLAKLEEKAKQDKGQAGKNEKLRQEMDVELNFLREKARIEREENEQKVKKSKGKVVTYGSPGITLRHLQSQLVVTAFPQTPSATSKDCFKLELSEPTVNSTLLILPRYKLRQEGESVYLGDDLRISPLKSGTYLHVSAGSSARSAEDESVFEVNITPAMHLGAVWRCTLFSPSGSSALTTAQDSELVHVGDALVLTHTELGTALQCPPLTEYLRFKEKEDAERTVELVSRPASAVGEASAIGVTSFFNILAEGGRGGVAEWRVRYHLRNMVTHEYLAVDRDVTVAPEEGSGDPAAAGRFAALEVINNNGPPALANEDEVLNRGDDDRSFGSSFGSGFGSDLGSDFGSGPRGYDTASDEGSSSADIGRGGRRRASQVSSGSGSISASNSNSNSISASASASASFADDGGASLSSDGRGGSFSGSDVGSDFDDDDFDSPVYTLITTTDVSKAAFFSFHSTASSEDAGVRFGHSVQVCVHPPDDPDDVFWLHSGRLMSRERNLDDLTSVVAEIDLGPEAPEPMVLSRFARVEVGKKQLAGSAFRLQPADKDLLKNALYAMSVVPELKSFGHDPRGQADKNFLVSKLLSDLVFFTALPGSAPTVNPLKFKGVPDPRRQQLLVDLKVPDLLAQILESLKGAYGSAIADPNKPHMKICQLCYSALYHIFEGNRSCENYCARWIDEIFIDQIDVPQIGSSFMLTELLSNNRKLLEEHVTAEVIGRFVNMLGEQPLEARYLEFLVAMCGYEDPLSHEEQAVETIQALICESGLFDQGSDLLLRLSLRGDEIMVAVGGKRPKELASLFYSPAAPQGSPVNTSNASNASATAAAAYHGGPRPVDAEAETEVTFLIEELNLLAEVTLNRNYLAVGVVEDFLGGAQEAFKLVSLGIKDQRLGPAVRASFVRVMINLFVCRDVRGPVLVPRYMRFADELAGAITFPAGRDDQDGGGGFGVFGPLKEFVAAFLKSLQGKVVAEDVEANHLSFEVVRLLGVLVQYGAYRTPEELKAIAAPLVLLLDGRSDLMTFDEQPTDPVQVYPDERTIPRYKRSSQTKVIMGAKLEMCRIITRILDLRLDARVSESLAAALKSSRGGDSGGGSGDADEGGGLQLSRLPSIRIQAATKASDIDFAEVVKGVPLTAVMWDLFMHEDASLRSAVLELLAKNYIGDAELEKMLDLVLLLKTPKEIAVGRDHEACCHRLRDTLEKAEINDKDEVLAIVERCLVEAKDLCEENKFVGQEICRHTRFYEVVIDWVASINGHPHGEPLEAAFDFLVAFVRNNETNQNLVYVRLREACLSYLTLGLGAEALLAAVFVDNEGLSESITPHLVKFVCNLMTIRLGEARDRDDEPSTRAEIIRLYVPFLRAIVVVDKEPVRYLQDLVVGNLFLGDRRQLIFKDVASSPELLDLLSDCTRGRNFASEAMAQSILPVRRLGEALKRASASKHEEDKDLERALLTFFHHVYVDSASLLRELPDSVFSLLEMLASTGTVEAIDTLEIFFDEVYPGFDFDSNPVARIKVETIASKVIKNRSEDPHWADVCRSITEQRILDGADGNGGGGHTTSQGGSKGPVNRKEKEREEKMRAELKEAVNKRRRDRVKEAQAVAAKRKKKAAKGKGPASAAGAGAGDGAKERGTLASMLMSVVTAPYKLGAAVVHLIVPGSSPKQSMIEELAATLPKPSVPVAKGAVDRAPTLNHRNLVTVMIKHLERNRRDNGESVNVAALSIFTIHLRQSKSEIQNFLAERGLAKLVVSWIGLPQQTLSQTELLAILEVGEALLRGGNVDVQRQFLRLLKSGKGQFFEGACAQLALGTKQAAVTQGDGHTLTVTRISRTVKPLLRLLQQLSEGQMAEMQNLMRSQPEAARSFDVLAALSDLWIAMCKRLRRVRKRGAQLIKEEAEEERARELSAGKKGGGGAKGGGGGKKKPVSFGERLQLAAAAEAEGRIWREEDVELALQLLETMGELVLGPNEESQASLASSVLLDATYKLLQELMDADIVEDEPAMALRASIIKLLTACLEGRTDRLVHERCLATLNISQVDALYQRLDKLPSRKRKELRPEREGLIVFLCMLRNSNKGHEKMVRSIEVKLPGPLKGPPRLINHFFGLPSATKYFSTETKDHIVVAVDREAIDSQLKDFFTWATTASVEMEHQKNLSRLLPFVRYLGHHKATICNFTYLFVIIINIFLIARLKAGPESRDSVFQDRTTRGLGWFVTFGFALITAVNWLNLGPVIIRAGWADGKNPFRKVFNPIAGIVREAKIMVYSAGTLLGLVAVLNNRPFLFAVHLYEIINRTETLKNVIRSATHQGSMLLWTAALAVLLIYQFSLLGFFYFSGDFGGADNPGCTSLFDCFLTTMTQGLRAGGGIGDYLQQPPVADDRTFLPRFFYDLSFFILVTIILINISSGVIIDSFSALRDKQSEMEDKINNRCFICNLPRDTLHRYGDYEVHIKSEHHMWNYLFFLVLINSKDKTDRTGIEAYVHACVQKESTKWIPLATSLLLARSRIADREAGQEDDGGGD